MKVIPEKKEQFGRRQEKSGEQQSLKPQVGGRPPTGKPARRELQGERTTFDP